MTDLPPPHPGDLLPPGPSAGGRTPQLTPFAQGADAGLRWFGQQHVAVKVLLAITLWWVLLPLLIVKGSNAHGAGLAVAGVTLVFGGLFTLAVATVALDPQQVGAAGGSTDAPVAAEPDPTAVPLPSPSPSSSPSPSPSLSPSPSPRPSLSPTASPTPGPSPAPDPLEEVVSASPRGDDVPVVLQGRVVDIVDGDTIDLSDGTRVRIAIADTPEVHGGIEPCGPEASDFTGSFLAGQTVAVYRPVGAPATDSFGRSVGEVVRVTDGASLNVALVAAGLATIDERFTSEDPDLAARLHDAATSADSPTCATQPDPEPESEPEPEPEPDPEPEPEPEPDNSGHAGNLDGGYDCHPDYVECLPQVGDLNCGDIGHQVDLFGSSDAYRLDADSDLVGCESSSPWSSSGSYPYY